MKYKTLAEFTATKQRMNVIDFENKYDELIHVSYIDNVLVYAHGLHIECAKDYYFMHAGGKDWYVYGEENLELLEAKLYNHYQERCENDESHTVLSEFEIDIIKTSIKYSADYMNKMCSIIADKHEVQYHEVLFSYIIQTN